MSGLEIVASIAGVAAAAIKVSVAMNDLAEELGSAGKDVRYIGNDMAGFSQVLRLVQSSLEESINTAGSRVIQSVFDTLPQLIEQCSTVYDEANGLMVAINPKDSSLSVFKKMKFVFYRGRITILRSLLDSSKSTLNLLLVTLNIEMAKSKMPDKALMEQLQNERIAFIKVVQSQNKALDEAMKEVEKAKKEATRLKLKRDKEKEKDRGDGKDEDATLDDVVPERLSRPYSYKPPPPYTLHSAPSVSQLIYQPPSLERFNSVRKSSNAVASLALSLEPTRTTGDYGVPTPPISPPEQTPHGAYASYTAYTPPPPPSQSATNENPKFDNRRSADDAPPVKNTNNARPGFSGTRVFSDPGPARSNATSKDHLDPGVSPREQERERSPYGFSRVPQEESPKVEKKRPTSQAKSPSASSGSASYRNFSTPASGNSKMNSVPEEQEPASAGANGWPTTPMGAPWKPKFTYHPPPPPPPPAYPTSNDTYAAPQPKSTSIPRKSVPPPPPPRHGITYVVIEPYLSHEIGHLSLVPFDTLVDVSSYTPEEELLPYPTAFDSAPKHYWQASLGTRRGPRGLFPHDTVCSIDSEKVTEKLNEAWFAEKEAGFIADGQGRCWVGPTWEWREPARRRSKWWAEGF
ncbi:hypothetical protein FB567DRAFT_511732 [Paraphoma chrysanthemicola]|uniref:Azaphilone pigments biosynthesis cluster protein L N-terminal domain-containing protein n=1 Tax=Paraphoma chrysanthemicola TaxID=798071 RepID=A0A8K0RHE7_9PLEO|nr:hypothetical protein FB567DRAFT_511732 [Paraphoma chrysanthemicola]